MKKIILALFFVASMGLFWAVRNTDPDTAIIGSIEEAVIESTDVNMTDVMNENEISELIDNGKRVWYKG